MTAEPEKIDNTLTSFAQIMNGILRLEPSNPVAHAACYFIIPKNAKLTSRPTGRSLTGQFNIDLVSFFFGIKLVNLKLRSS